MKERLEKHIAQRESQLNEKEFHITANGFDMKTRKYDIPECYVKAFHFMDAFQILSEYLKTGAHANKVRLV